MFHSVHQLAANFFLSSVWCCSVSVQWAYKNFSTEDSCLLWKLGWWQCRDWGHKSAPQLKGTAGMIFYSSIDPHKSHTLDLSVSLYDATAGFHGCAVKPFSAMFSKMNTYSSTYKTTSRYSVLDTTTDRTSTCEGSLKGGLFSRATVYPTIFSASNQTSSKIPTRKTVEQAWLGEVHSLLKVHQQRQVMFPASERGESLLSTMIHTQI